MPDRIYDQSINNFLTQAIAPTHTPGGANVSAVAATLACSMVAMVASLTIGKKAYAAVEREAREVLAECQHLIERLKELTHQDMAAFDDYMAAYRMPKDTEAQLAAKQAALEQAAQNATFVPLGICQACLEVIAQAHKVVRFGNKMAISDAGVGATLGLGALRSAMLSVEANLPVITNREYVQNAQDTRARLLTQGDELCAATLVKIRERVA